MYDYVFLQHHFVVVFLVLCIEHKYRYFLGIQQMGQNNVLSHHILHKFYKIFGIFNFVFVDLILFATVIHINTRFNLFDLFHDLQKFLFSSLLAEVSAARLKFIENNTKSHLKYEMCLFKNNLLIKFQTEKIHVFMEFKL